MVNIFLLSGKITFKVIKMLRVCSLKHSVSQIYAKATSDQTRSTTYRVRERGICRRLSSISIRSIMGYKSCLISLLHHLSARWMQRVCLSVCSHVFVYEVALSIQLDKRVSGEQADTSSILIANTGKVKYIFSFISFVLSACGCIPFKCGKYSEFKGIWNNKYAVYVCFSTIAL